jgi:16S rRNA (uracil1498-N3)-methyltransferase
MERVIVFDGSGYDFVCEIQEYQGSEVVLNILEKKLNSTKPLHHVVLYAAIIKKDNFEWIVQKATELGVSDIVPVLSDRSEKKNINTERLEKIIREAAEQSGGGILPRLHQVVSLRELLSSKSLLGGMVSSAVVFDPTGEKLSARGPEKIYGSVGLFIGPEGGWSAEEISAFKKAGVAVRSLGPRILRAETAAVAALAQFLL